MKEARLQFRRNHVTGQATKQLRPKTNFLKPMFRFRDQCYVTRSIILSWLERSRRAFSIGTNFIKNGSLRQIL